MTNSEPSALSEWFHEFAEQPLDQIALHANEMNRALFARHAAISLPNHKPPEAELAEDFAQTVHRLRENERQWNHALMSALISSADMYESKDREGAIATLESFAESCPWRLFQDVARRQRSSYKPL